MHPSDKIARVAGGLYLLMGVPAVFSLMYVPNRLVVAGNADATAGNVTGFEMLFRLGMAAELAAAVFLLLLALALHRLLGDVDRNHARLMVGLVLASVAISFTNVLNSLAALTLFRGTDYLAALDHPQREALGMLFLVLHRQGIGIVGIFWGLWLLPLGVLVMRSVFLPRILGVLLILNCAGYVAASLTTLLVPSYANVVSRVVMPTLLGELWLMLWLLIRGARPQSSAA
ncbi:MAG TPA: DUF4386 domain-containing protein [Candidatus Polarisedimenticolia bacterium]|nr:DUF4386 domain-containing protein [Candidatus Polarisedimenticolia bacterium]